MVKKENSDEIEIEKFVMNTLKNKYFQWSVTIILFLLILYSSTALRLGNLNVLKSQVDEGVYLSNDLDSMYFYRMAETQLELGYLPKIDNMRAPGYNIGWVPEIIDNVLILNYKVLNFFNSSINFNYASTISAPILFALLLIVFFILCLALTKSKIGSLAAATFLAYAPVFLFRSIAGFYDHDHLGVLAVLVLVLASVFSLKRFSKNWTETIVWALVLGFFTSFVFVSWAGAITFVFLFLPLSLFLVYLGLEKNEESKFFAFYGLWIVGMTLFSSLIGGSAKNMILRILDSQGLAVIFVLGFSIVDFIFIRFKNNLKFINEKYEKLYSFVVAGILGIVGLLAIGKNPIKIVQTVWASLIYPFFGDFSGRLSATVAENAQPYLIDLIGQNGKILFWLFSLGLIVLGFNMVSKFKSTKNKLYFGSTSSFILIAILVSRISPDHILNGENFISQGIYLLGVILFFVALLYTYNREKFKIPIEVILIFSIALTTVINARAAVRSFFLITPFIALIAGYFIAELVKKLEIENE